MLAVTRHEIIKELLLEKKTIQVSEVSKLLEVSEETVRRDFSEMEKHGLLKKIHGGAVLTNRVQSYVDNTTLKRIFRENKEIMAKRAKFLINDGDSIFLDSTTTSLQLSEVVIDRNVTIITNSVDIMNYLSNFDNIHLVGIGGEYYSQNRCFIGKDAMEIIGNYHIDKAFISPKSLDMEWGVTHVNQNSVAFLQMVLKRSKYKILVVDHSKFNKVSLLKLGDFRSIDYLITDKELSEEWQDFLEDEQIVYVDDDNPREVEQT